MEVGLGRNKVGAAVQTTEQTLEEESHSKS